MKDDKNKYFTRDYWEKRYKTGGNSGFGSHDAGSVKFKGDYISNLIKKYGVETLFDYGCGDGNQLPAIKGYTNYFGYDIAANVVDLCKSKFVGDETKFFSSNLSDILIRKYDMAISMDVTYHIIEEELFELYLDNLFNAGNIVVLFTTNNDSKTSLSHHHPRKVIDYIGNKFTDFKLIDMTPYNDNVGFYTYQKIEI